MQNYLDLAETARRFVRNARERPSEAVGAALDDLDEKAKSALSGSFVAQTSPMAPLRWMNRVVLQKGVLQTELDPFDIPYPVEIVGFLPTVLLIDTNIQTVQPPLEAIDVYIQLNNDAVLTNRANRVSSQTQDYQVVNTPAISAREGNCLFDLILPEARNLITIKFGWAVDLATVAAQAYGDVQLTLNYYMRERKDLRK